LLLHIAALHRIRSLSRDVPSHSAGVLLNKFRAKDDPDLQAKILIRSVLIESCSGRYNDALRFLTDAAELFEESNNHALKGKFHNELALTLMFLGKAEQCSD
jgi:hypothetical protein